MKDIRNYSLLAHNTFGIDAKCSRFLEYESVEEARQIVGLLTEADQPLLILGGGSNLLLTGDYAGTVLHSAIMGIEVLDNKTLAAAEGDDALCNPDWVFLSCGSGEVFDDVVAYAVEHGYHGAENLSIIPGEVGASAVQNIGAYGVEAKDVIYKVEAVEIATGRVVVFDNADCEYSYRQSKFKHEWKDKYLVTHVIYRLQMTFCPDLDYGNIRSALEAKHIAKPTAQQLRDVIIEIREAKLPDPKVLGNAGSFFMNPIVEKDKYEELAALYPGMPHYTIDDAHEKIPAGWMIDQCGWKGKSLGRAGVHDKQALVLVNRGGATGEEIVKLCKTIQEDVKQKFGIEIHPEVNVK
ncbi:MAG: UDP-N-acetylmuramate dehydrogenase [Segatella copri]|nr:UDP-N-acetylmuramate dehydrogenase [Segatella copri]